VLAGGLGADSIYGGSGVDTITGGLGKDFIVGQAGTDRYVYNAYSDSGPSQAARDVISGFAHGEKISLSAIDANLNVSGNQAFSFVQNFTGVAGQLQWDQTGAFSFLVSADLTGDTVADFSLQLDVGAGFNQVLASDFVL
jgi:serralysin